MDTEFWAGVLVARLIEGAKFAVGLTTAPRKSVLQEIGGWDRLKDYLAEDFMLGALAATKGRRVILSLCVVEHRIGSEPLPRNFSHRLRWARSTRRSRPAGYVGQLFTNPSRSSCCWWRSDRVGGPFSQPPAFCAPPPLGSLRGRSSEPE
jgi:ceramide glucosyltransferase